MSFSRLPMKLDSSLSDEISRQTENLLQKGYPGVAGMSTRRFRSLVEPLGDHVPSLDVPRVNLEKGQAPLVIVIKSAFIASERAMSLVEYGQKNGATKMYPRQPGDFQTI